MKQALLILGLAAALAGCQTTGQSDAPTAGEDARNLSEGLADAIQRCWFGENEPAFDGYIYTPETVGGRPRILLASKDDPGGRPALVIEPADDGKVSVYGPLAGTGLGPRIMADIDRWRTGGTACGS